ncbi:MAG TPA: carboxypeptidase-like regulatory domain-containing protein [Terriglobales bacterium]|nr:carboxypeptidase-like regulatory domain-containing protein [Terriglobales bacterium]
MKRVIAIIAFAGLTAIWLPAQINRVTAASGAEKNTSQVRLLTGEVMDKAEAPLPNAVVYLKNTKTLTVKTFITDSGGQYRFPALSPNVDYEVYAEHNGRKSDIKTLSSFDTRPSARINLKVQ